MLVNVKSIVTLESVLLIANERTNERTSERASEQTIDPVPNNSSVSLLSSVAGPITRHNGNQRSAEHPLPIDTL